MLRIAIGLLLVISSSTGRIAFIGNAGGKALFLLGLLLIAYEYIAQVARHRQMFPDSISISRLITWRQAK